jgi:two-component system, OmpR family, response regulator
MNRKLDDARSSKQLRILLVEDEPLIAEEISDELERQGYTVAVAANLEDGLHASLIGDASLVILDRMLNGLDGLKVIEAMREKGIVTPIMILSGLASIDDRIRGLRAGGDDYLVKPFAMGELVARVEVLLRRGRDTRVTRLSFGPLELDLVEHSVRMGGKPIDLLPREFKLLEYFMRHPNEAISREALLKDVWHHDSWRQTNVVDVHLSNLRRKINVDGEPPLISNVRGAGFILQIEHEEATPSRRAVGRSAPR